MEIQKPRVLKDFDNLDQSIIEQIKLAYPFGFADELISFPGKDGNTISALPFETEEKYYMIKMSAREADRIIDEDDDYDDGVLREDVKMDYQEKHEDIEDIAEETTTDD